jgi:serine/threonine protein kinase
LNLLKKCNHKNVVELLGYSKNENFYYLIFDLMEGGDLRYLLDNFFLKDTIKMNILFDIAKGMEYLHSINLIHRGLL